MDPKRPDRRAAALLVAFMLLVVWILMHAPRPAAGAVRARMSWTAPGGGTVRSIETQARRPDGSVVPLTPYADSTGTAAPRLAAPGARQDVWVLVSEDWRSGAWMVCARSCNTVGCSDWSNWGVVIAAAPDTLWHLERIGNGPRMAPRDSVEWKHAGGLVGWSLQRGDSMTVATIMHQEVVQLRELPAICRFYGYYGLRGGRVPCP